MFAELDYVDLCGWVIDTLRVHRQNWHCGLHIWLLLQLTHQLQTLNLLSGCEQQLTDIRWAEAKENQVDLFRILDPHPCQENWTNHLVLLSNCNRPNPKIFCGVLFALLVTLIYRRLVSQNTVDSEVLKFNKSFAASKMGCFWYFRKLRKIILALIWKLNLYRFILAKILSIWRIGL